MTHYPVSRDRRYTVAREYTGHISGKPVWVARFEGGWIASSPFYTTAAGRAIGAHAVANGAQVVTGQPEARP